MNLLQTVLEPLAKLDFDPLRQSLAARDTLCLASLLILAVLLATGAALLVNAVLLVPFSTTVAVVLTVALMRRLSNRPVDEFMSADELNHLVWRGREPSLRDPRTMLMQKWYFELRLAEEAERCRRHGMEMSVLFVPAETEKTWPEAPGAAGAEISRTAFGALRLTDLAAKINHRQYAVCLPHTSEAQGRAAARRLLGEVNADADNLHLAVCPGDGMNLLELLANARPFPGSEPAPVPQASKPRRSNDALVRLLRTSQSGIVPMDEGQTIVQLKARVRRASLRALVKVKVWEEDELLYFERIEHLNPAEAVKVA
jgi:GGDEF domain-containing protein